MGGRSEGGGVGEVREGRVEEVREEGGICEGGVVGELREEGRGRSGRGEVGGGWKKCERRGGRREAREEGWEK